MECGFMVERVLVNNVVMYDENLIEWSIQTKALNFLKSKQVLNEELYTIAKDYIKQKLHI